jgi:cell division septation protein DedD
MSGEHPYHPETNEVIAQRYQLGRQLREEPWGGVWLAQDNLLRTQVSLKLLARDAPEWAAARDMFEQAAILGLKLRHPQILGVFHVDKAERFLYLVEEPFPGESLLTQLVRPERLSLPKALHRLELLGQALAFAHEQGEVHQGLSPVNILLEGEDLRLANFAFAPSVSDQPLHLELKAYAPPEVINGDPLTRAGNVFSLGVLGFRLVAGSLPYALTFDEPFPYRLEYPPVDLEEIPVPLQNVLLRCLTEDPEERLPHAGAFIEQLRQARELMPGIMAESDRVRRPARPRLSWQSLAQAGPALKKVWEGTKPHAQKAREAARNHVSTLKQAPRRLWWGVGLAVLMVALIIVGVKVRPRPAAPPQPSPVAAPVPRPAAGGGPPLAATSAPAPVAPVTAVKAAPRPSRPPAPAARAAEPTRGSALATRGGNDERYILVAATYVNKKPAQALQRRLRARHLHAVIHVRKTSGKTLYQVRVGPITGAKAAQEAARQIKAQEKLSPTVVKLASRSPSPNHRKQSR